MIYSLVLKSRPKAFAFAAFCTLIQFSSLNGLVTYLSTGTVV